MIVRLIWIITILATLTGCGEFEIQFRKVVSPNEVVDTHIYCSLLIIIPVFCSVEQNKIITVEVEKVVVEVVETIVEVEVIKEVIVEKIVTEIEMIYVEAEVDIGEIVPAIVARVKELVPEEDIIDVSLDEIIEEVTNELYDE